MKLLDNFTPILVLVSEKSGLAESNKYRQRQKGKQMHRLTRNEKHIHHKCEKSKLVVHNVEKLDKMNGHELRAWRQGRERARMSRNIYDTEAQRSKCTEKQRYILYQAKALGARSAMKLLFEF